MKHDFWFIQLIFGRSLDFIEFNFILIALLAGFFIKNYRKVGEIKAEKKHLN